MDIHGDGKSAVRQITPNILSEATASGITADSSPANGCSTGVPPVLDCVSNGAQTRAEAYIQPGIEDKTRPINAGSVAHASTPTLPLVSEFVLSKSEKVLQHIETLPRTRSGAVKKRSRISITSKPTIIPTKQVTQKAPPPLASNQHATSYASNCEGSDKNIADHLSRMTMTPAPGNPAEHLRNETLSFAPTASSSKLFELNNPGPTLFRFDNNTNREKEATTAPQERWCQTNSAKTSSSLNPVVSASHCIPVIPTNFINTSVSASRPNDTNNLTDVSVGSVAPVRSTYAAQTSQSSYLHTPHITPISIVPALSASNTYFSQPYSTASMPSMYQQAPRISNAYAAFPYNVPNNLPLDSYQTLHSSSAPQQATTSSRVSQFALNNSYVPEQLINTQYSVSPNATADYTLSASHVAARHAISKDLPSFSGKPDEWPLFITNYMQSTERCGFTDQENLIRLQKCLKGPALDAVRGKLMMPATVSVAVETLRMLYGRPEMIHYTLQCKLKQEQPVKKEKLETLINFALAVQNYRITMQAMGLADCLNDPMLLNDMLEKLPSDLKLDWGRYRSSYARADIVLFDAWLFNLATCAAQVTSYNNSVNQNTNEEIKGNRKLSKQRIFMHDIISQSSSAADVTVICPKCTNKHRLAECSEFTSLNTDERWKFIKENKLCLRCFKKHYLRRCNSKRQCNIDGCTLPHNPLLHSKQQQGQIKAKKLSAQNTVNVITTHEGRDGESVLFHLKEQKKTLFRYVPVTLFGNNRSLNTFALIDEAAACTLVEDEIALALGLDGPTEQLCLQWTSSITQEEKTSKKVTLKIAAREQGARKFCLNNVRTVTTLDLPVQTLDKSEIDSCVEFEGAPVLPYTRAKARILIGLDNLNICVPFEVKESNVNGLVAAKSRIGWSAYGRQHGIDTESKRLMHLCVCNPTDNLDNILKGYFSLESIGIKSNFTGLRSKDDERAMNIMKARTKYIESEKVWETGLLWKYENVSLPDSWPMARHRLQCLESKMLRNPELKHFLIEKIEHYEKMGYIRKLQKEEISSGGKVWYIPIFTVANKNKNKTRIVWDAAAALNGVSLNSALLKGPDFLNSLVGVLIRFREKPIALSGDIREMFHQVRVIKDDRMAQRFLWRNGDATKEIDVYVMNVMTFGASCSPSVANYVKNMNAERFRETQPDAVDAIIKNTFVDDWLQSVDTEEDMIAMGKTVHMIHRDGGFEMRNWLSNSKNVLNALSGESNQVNKCINDPLTQFEKVLGMWWIPSIDELTFVQKFDPDVFDKANIPSKRKILRIVMTIFDPLGLLGFFVIYAKILLQEIWRSGVTWDEPIGFDEQKKWRLWVELLPSIANVRIPRCYEFASRCPTTQLHVFVDASINAYAALVYLRAENGGTIKCSLVASKTRVAPLKPISIPKLELVAAVLGLRLANFVISELSIPITRRVFWSDSKNVLYWIKSDARKYQQFVAVRIGEILEGSNVEEWQWVSSADNVADDGTKWACNPRFDAKSRWFTGPDFLKKNECDWPVMKLNKTEGTIPELLLHINTQKIRTYTSLDAISPDPNRFSKFEKLRNTQLYVLKFLRLIRKVPFPSKNVEQLVSIKDISSAENIIIRKCQEEAYGDEINCLKSGRAVNRKSTIYKCSPYLDEFSILRVKGRIDAIDGVATSVKRPIIMPRKHIVSNLLTDFYHRKYHHHHNEIVVNEMRQRWWINGLRGLVNATSKHCQLCKNRRAKPSAPEMGNLPSERLAVFTRPFYFTGVDYFGPIEIVVGRRTEKRWGVLFTCMTVRAVHIEIAPSLSTDSFLLILKQFISRRGVPRRILSDNATNFRGASRILQDEVGRLVSGDIESKYPEIEWQFIPPASPHMGGSWERMIRSVKSVLMDILPVGGLREEVLRAALADVENILNSRPLTYVPLESAESEALTPNHFLIGCSSSLSDQTITGSSGVSLSKNFRISSMVADQFWKRWVREYLPCLTRRTKWYDSECSSIAIGDVVVIVDENTKRNTWQRGIVIDVHHAKDNKIRSAVVKTGCGLLTRPSVKLAKLDVKR